MKEDLIKLIDQIDEIQAKFHPGYVSAFTGESLGVEIYDVEEFIEWLQAIKFELQDIFDRTHDAYIWNLINATGVIHKFDGRNHKDRDNFNDLKGALKVIQKNIDKYYPQQHTKLLDHSQGVNQMKPTKVFISHSSKDIDFVSPLVELLADIGLTNDNMFCSSVSDYGIPLGENIYDYLSDQFRNYNLFVIFVLSENYYNSPACLNEMGAAWVLKNDYVSVLVPGFTYENIKGAANPNKIGMKLDESDDFLRKHLGDLKDALSEKLSISVPGNRWEKKRNDFIDTIKTLTTR